jgi:hypothetical protein
LVRSRIQDKCKIYGSISRRRRAEERRKDQQDDSDYNDTEEGEDMEGD